VLRWHAENVTSVSLYDSALDVTLNYPVNNITFTDNVVYRPVYYPTTLTVTATGPCGSVSKSFSMTPHPTRCDARYTTGLRAGCTPFTLNFDASSSWDIDNDIISYEWDFDNDGITDATGINVSYTYTKRGAYNAFLTIKDAAGNSSSYSELVRVHSAPEVTFTSDTGGVIGPDGYVTLRWETVDATNVCLDINGSCGYNFNGAERVAQTGTRTYTITVSNDCSTTTKTLTIRPDSPISVNITSPASNESISSTDTIVRGTVSNPLGGETMVVVNGIPAFLYGNQFVASGVPLERDMPTTITVDAIGEFGNKGQASLDVTSRVSRKLVSISCDDMTGMSPMETKLKVSVPSSLSYQLVSLRPASGNIEFTESAEEYIHPARLTGEGVYIFTVKATDTDNREYSDSISIVVQDKAKIDTLLRSKWDDMKEAMRNNDVEGALKNFSGASTNEYREIFTILRDKLPELAQNMSNMEPVYINETVAKYRIKRNQVINGEQHTITYYVSFTIDPFGKWSIDGF
jgi:PKD repeat protein